MKCSICSSEFAEGGPHCPSCTAKLRLPGDKSTSFGKSATAPTAVEARVVWTASAESGADLKWPLAVALHPNGDVYVLDQPEDFRVLRFDSRGTPLGVLLTTEPGQLEEPTAFGFAPDGRLYIADGAADQIGVWNADGRFLRMLGGKGTAAGRLARPVDLALDRDGCIYVAEAFNRRVQKLSPEGLPYLEVKDAGQLGRFEEPVALALDSTEVLLLADRAANRVFRFSFAGQARGYWPAPPHPATMFDAPCGIRVGADGTVYVADRDFTRIHRLSPNGEPRSAITLGRGESECGNFAVRESELLLPDRLNDRLLCVAFPDEEAR